MSSLPYSGPYMKKQGNKNGPCTDPLRYIRHHWNEELTVEPLSIYTGDSGPYMKKLLASGSCQKPLIGQGSTPIPIISCNASLR